MGINSLLPFGRIVEFVQTVRDAVQQAPRDNPEVQTVAGQPQTQGGQTPPNVKDAQTPQEAVIAIHSMPPPDNSDLPQNMPSYSRDEVGKQRAQTYNQNRAGAANGAIEQFKPKREDFGPPGANGDREYQDAVNSYNNDPYVKELHRIEAEATGQPDKIPAYLQPQQPNDPAKLTVAELRDVLKPLGIDLPLDASPEQIQAAREIVGTIPGELFGPLIDPGMQVSYTGPGIGASTPGPIRFTYDYLTPTATVGMSDKYVGVNFQETQTFEASVRVTAGVGAEVGGKTTPQQMYTWANRLNLVSPEAKALVDGSPILRGVLKGLPIPVGGSYQQYAGYQLKFESVVTPQQAKEIEQNGPGAGPNPLDPLNTMPTGTSVMIRGQDLEGSSFALSWKYLNGESSHTNLDGQGFGVRRLEGDVVEVYAGPVKTVEDSTFLGVGKPGLASVGVQIDSSSETQNMSVARIDLSTAEGQAAYQEFMNSGQVPNWSPPGVQQSGKSEIYSGDHAVKLGANVGPVSVGFGNKSNLTITRTTWADGTIDQQNTYVENGNHTTDVTFKIGKDGKPIESETTWRIVMADVDPQLALMYKASDSTQDVKSQQSLDGPQHLQLTFTSSELMGLKGSAREFLLETGGEEFVRQIESGERPPQGPIQELVAAKTPEDVFLVVDRNPHDVGTMLVSQRKFEGDLMPGTVQIKDAG